MADDFGATRQPEIGEERFILMRTIVSSADGGSFDPRFANYDLHPLAPGTTEDDAFEMATALADEDATYMVMIGHTAFTGAVDGVAKMRLDAAKAAGTTVATVKTS